MKFIKLTLECGDKWFLNMDNVIYFGGIYDNDKFLRTNICQSNDEVDGVKETPEQIVALIDPSSAKSNEENLELLTELHRENLRKEIEEIRHILECSTEEGFTVGGNTALDEIETRLGLEE